MNISEIAEIPASDAVVDKFWQMLKMRWLDTKMQKRKNLSIRYVQVKSDEGMCWREEGKQSDRADGELFNRIVHGDALNELGKYPPECIDLIFTSPP